MLKSIALLTSILALLPSSQPIQAAESPTTNSPLLSIERLFGSDEFSEKHFGAIVWAKSGAGFYKFEKADS